MSYKIGIGVDIDEDSSGRCSRRECDARQQIVRDIIKAKRDAGFPLNSVFFRDVWPKALEAYLRSRGKR